MSKEQDAFNLALGKLFTALFAFVLACAGTAAFCLAIVYGTDLQIDSWPWFIGGAVGWTVCRTIAIALCKWVTSVSV